MAGIDTVTFPHGCVWINEHEGSNVSHDRKNALDGTLYVQSFKRKAGRSVQIDARWLSSANVYALQALVDQDAQMVLTLSDNRQLNVMWDQNNTPLKAEAIKTIADRTDEPDAPWAVLLNLIQV